MEPGWPRHSMPFLVLRNHLPGAGYKGVVLAHSRKWSVDLSGTMDTSLTVSRL